MTPASNFVGLKTPISVFHHDSAAIFPIAVTSSFQFGSLCCFAYCTKNPVFSAFSTGEKNWGARVLKVTLLGFLHKSHPQLPFSVTTWSKILPSLSYSPDFSPFTNPEGPLSCSEDLNNCTLSWAIRVQSQQQPFFRTFIFFNVGPSNFGKILSACGQHTN